MASTPVDGPDLCYVRGDTAPIVLRFKSSGAAKDLTGYTGFLLTVNPSKAPVNSIEQVTQFGGSIPTPTSGEVEFVPADQAASDALVPQKGLFYDVQWIDASSRKASPIRGKFEIVQDITKE